MTKPVNLGSQLPSERTKKAEELKKNYAKLREHDRQKVRGKFIFHEVPGGTFSFVFGPFYKGDETERYDFVDGGVYEIPLGVAKHLNKNGWYPEYGFIPGDQNVQTGYSPSSGMAVKHKVRRFSFQSLEFLDLDEMPSGHISQVETVAL